MASTRWADVRADMTEKAGGEEAVAEAREERLAEEAGFKLAELRRALKLTQKQIAERMGVSKGRVSQIERGLISTPGRSRALRGSPGRPSTADHPLPWWGCRSDRTSSRDCRKGGRHAEASTRREGHAEFIVALKASANWCRGKGAGGRLRDCFLGLPSRPAG